MNQLRKTAKPFKNSASKNTRPGTGFLATHTRYRYTNTLNTVNGEISISLLVEKGRITEVSFSGEMRAEIGQKLADALVECRHDQDAIKTALFRLNEEFQRGGMSVELLIDVMF